MGFLDRIMGASGSRGRKTGDARTCDGCKNFTHCKRREMGNNDTCENYDEKT
jgi:hypothetical protein